VLTQIIDSAVDVDWVAQFCLGRFWRQASPPQQQRFVMLFHQVLVSNIMAKLGEYQGVKFTVGRSRRQDEDEIVSSVVERPNNPPTNVDWAISDPDSSPKIIDVIAEGTSFRLTPAQRLCLLPGAQQRRCADQRPAAAGGAEQLVLGQTTYPDVWRVIPASWRSDASALDR